MEIWRYYTLCKITRKEKPPTVSVAKLKLTDATFSDGRLRQTVLGFSEQLEFSEHGLPKPVPAEIGWTLTDFAYNEKKEAILIELDLTS